MQTIKLLTFILILSSGGIYSQQGWFWLNPLPQGNYLNNASYVSSSVVYISGNGGTLMKSTNAGVNFSFVTTGLRDDLNVTFINELTGFSIGENGIFRTTSGGLSWQYFHILSEYKAAQIQYTGNNLLYVLMINETENIPVSSIYRSTDLGVTWTLSLNPPPATYLRGLHFVNQSSGYSVGQKNVYPYSPPFTSKIYRTINSGITWDSIASNMDVFYAVYFLNTLTGFVTSRNSILRTTTGGMNWVNVHSNSMYPINRIRFFNDAEGYSGGWINIVKSTTGGTNWQLVYPEPGGFIHLNDINNGIVFATYGGQSGGFYVNKNNLIYRTTNSGYNLIPYSTGFGYELTDVFFINPNTGFIGTYDARILKSTNSGVNWSVYQHTDLSVENIQFVNENTGYAGLSWGKFAKTTNCGLNWIISATGFYDHNHGISFPSADTGFAVTKYGRCIKTVNGANSWFDLGRPAGDYYGDIYFINNTTGFSAGDSNWSGQGASIGVLRSTTNGGINWHTFYIDSVSYFRDACASESNSFFAAGFRNNRKGIIARSTNIGLDWDYIEFPSEITAIHFQDLNTGYASTSGCIMYKTTNNGDSWVPTESVNSNHSYGLFFINEYTGWAVGYTGQIIKTTTGGGAPIGIQPVSSVIPESFLLHQNYPNPFNPLTKIRFSIPVMQNPVSASLTIYDILGREVKTLLNQNLTAGEYSVDFDASNLPSGVYFYQLRSGDFTASKKMILLK